MRKKIIYKSYINLIISSFLVGALATLMAASLKIITEIAETAIFGEAKQWPLLFIILPSVGITIIYFTRKYLFRGKKNKGIKEIFRTLEHRKDELPLYKVPSHYINGFLTVIFGGSTGVEVSTVVATAAIGATAYGKRGVPNPYKTELICAGVAAGIATLFGSPIAGLLFAMEVISRKFTRTIFISCMAAVLSTWLYMYYFAGEKLFGFSVISWKMEAVPFMILVCVLAGIVAVYFTKSVIFIKGWFSLIKSNFLRVNIGALLVGGTILFLPQLYGDSYHAIPDLLQQSNHFSFTFGFGALLFFIVVLKPIVASLTLGAGGDGGVFAPSIVTGAILGMLVAVCCNHYFNTHLIVINFVLIGAAAMLSAAIHAPLTALFLVCGIAEGGFILFVPILVGSFIAKYVAKFICNYTVYTYSKKPKSISVSSV